jgi:two-component system, cell cycle sensor histidine kinase and response regulator CckA
MSEIGGRSPGGARTPAADAIRSKRAEGPGLLSRIPGMAYQSGADPERIMQFVSAGARALTGYDPSQLAGSTDPTFTGLIVPMDRDRVIDAMGAALETQAPWDLEYRITNTAGEERWVWDRGQVILSATGDVIGLEGFVTDVTARRSLEEGLLRSQKLEALGELTGSIAHDFNNLLTAIIAPVELIIDELEPSSPVARQLTQVNETAHYAASLTQQLLAFCRKQAPVRRVVDVNQVVQLLEPTLKRIVRERVRLVIERAEVPLAAYVDPSHLEQVIVNLVVNARDAEPKGGEVRVSIDEATLADRDAARLGVDPGIYVTIEVQDNGVGIPPEVVDRIFEPFFTTKDEGTGLGLATVYGIVTQHKGAVDVESKLGEGSTFRVYLPLIDAPVEDLAQLRARRPRGGVGTGSVLLVEDDNRVREALAEALRRYGYEVHAAKDGDTARDRVRGASGKIDVIVCDIILEDTLGPDLVASLRDLLPTARVIYVSGYADEEAWERIQHEPGVLVLQKPFALGQLLEAVGRQ